MKTIPLASKKNSCWNTGKMTVIAAELLGLADIPFNGIVIVPKENPKDGSFCKINVPENISREQEKLLNALIRASWIGRKF